VGRYKTKGIVICYDLYADYDPENGKGIVPSAPLRKIRKQILEGGLTRLQDSVLLLKRPELLGWVLDLLRPYAKSIVVIPSDEIVIEYRS